MQRLLFYIVMLGCVMVMVFNAALLDFLGWGYMKAGASNVTKIHPAFYVFAAGVLIAPFVADRQTWGLYLTLDLPFVIAGVIMLARAAVIASSGVTGGEVSAVLVTFLMPAMMLICLRTLTRGELRGFAMPLRAFFVFNSVMGLAERLIGHRLIPSWMDVTFDQRACGLLAHPLNASLLTGMMIVFLVTARRSAAPIWYRLPELALHITAMFAFGGRSALVFTVIIILFSAVVGRQRRGEVRLTAMQRLLPLAIIAVGVALVFLPIPFIDATMDRFANDNHSAETRDSAAQMLRMLTPAELLVGVDYNRRIVMMTFFHSQFGIELAWVALLITYGAVAVIPMFLALPYVLYMTSRPLDRSAFYMMLLFFAVTAGSLSIGVKSLLVAQTLVMMLGLAQRAPVTTPLRRGEADQSEPSGLFGFDPDRIDPDRIDPDRTGDVAIVR